MSSVTRLPIREATPGTGGREGQGRSAGQGQGTAPGAGSASILLPAGDEVCNYEYSYDDLFTERLRAAGQPVTHLQVPLPAEYVGMAPADLDARIARARAALGERVMILGHHYQRNEIIKFADARGDSYKLSQLAAERKESEFIVFCGVHFMAESADILSGDHQQVILPNLAAGCSMADMAQTDDVLDCWAQLQETLGPDHGIVPVTY